MSNGKKRLTIWTTWLVVGLMAASAWAVSPEIVSDLKAKVARGESLTREEIILCRENPAELSGVLRHAVSRESSPRRPANPLDVYVSDEIDYEWVDILDTGQDAGIINDDEWVGPFDLGFDFDFYGQTYSQVYMTSNGWAGFVQPEFAEYWNGIIPDGLSPHGAMYVFWDDLYPPTGGQYKYQQDEDRFIMSWIDVPSIQDETALYSFQIVIEESGEIKYSYQSVTDIPPGNLSCTVGVENQASDDALQICAEGDGWLPITKSTLLISQPDGVPNAPTALQANVVDHTVNLSWQDPTQDTNGNPVVLTSVEIWDGTPSEGEILGTVAPGTEAYAVTGVADGSRRYSVRAYANPYYGTAVSVVALVGNPNYANNFDVNDGTWSSDLGWQWGEVTNPDVFPTYYSAPNVWGTGLETQYENLADWRVDLSPGLAIESTDSYMEFYCYYDCEGFEFAWYDGCNLKISIDGGVTWNILIPDGGYPADEVPTDWGNPIGGEPAWSGQSAGWIHVTVPLGDYSGEVPIFRFHLGTDEIVPDGYPGFFFDDMLIWGLVPPVFSTISGHVTFDGGMGNYSESLVRADGFGLPSAVPAGNGNYLISNVITGQRQVTASHPDYHSSTVDVNVPEGGATGVEITITRLDPPAPTNLTGSVDNETGIADLNWDTSTDPLVDQYRVFRRLSTEDWAQVGTSNVSSYQETLTADGIYQYRVTAVDLNVSTPVESEESNTVTVLFGALPVTSIGVNGNYDDRIRVSWLEPGTLEGTELGYDDGTSETWYRVDFPNGPQDLFAVRFSPPEDANYPLMIYSANIYMERSDLLPLVAICPSQAGVDGADLDNAWAEWNEIGADGDPGWLNAVTDGDIFLTEAQDFWVVMQFPPGIDGPGCGADQAEPDLRSYWTNTYPSWNQWMWNDWMMRVWVGGPPPEEGLASRAPHDMYMLSVGEPGGYAVHRIPAEQTAPAEIAALVSGDAKSSKKKETGPISRVSTEERNPLDKWFPPYSRAPQLELRSRDGGNALDDIVNYKVYRNNVVIAQPTQTNYMDLNRIENTDYTYYVTAMYDNGEESPASPTRVGRCNMEPLPPTNLQANPSGNTNMVLSWTAPTVNADSTPLVDLANYQVWRDGAAIATVPAGTTTYMDTPPQNDMFYTWTVTAQDEVPNVSAPSAPVEGAVVSPWEVVDYEWVDISGVGQDAGITDDDQIVGPFDLGFTVEFMGESYSSVSMCSNGWASFVQNQFGYYFNTAIPDPNEPNGIMYMFWDDLYPPMGGQYKYYQDTANDRFVMSWLGVPHISNTACTYTFQIVIESSGGIIYNYQSICDDFPGATSCTIGVENSDGSNGVEVLFDGSGAFTPDDETAIAFWAGPSGEITGLVREFGTNTPLQSAQITVAEDPELIAMTDVTGTYLLEVEPGTYTVTVHKQGYCDQVFTGVVVADEGTTTRNATMRQPNAHFSVTSLNILTVSGQSGSDVFEMTNPTPATCEISYDITTNQAWLHVTPESGDVPPNNSQTISVTADASALQPGDYAGAIMVNHNDHDSPYIIPVTLSVTTDVPSQSELPTQFALHTNYPNPFNATTSLRFDLPQESRVLITIFNIQGREVSRPVDEVMPAGFHQVSFTASDLPTGMYLIQMEAGSFNAVQKMVLLK